MVIAILLLFMITLRCVVVLLLLRLIGVIHFSKTSFFSFRRLIIFICVSIYARAENCLTVSVRKGIIMKRESSFLQSPPFSHF